MPLIVVAQEAEKYVLRLLEKKVWLLLQPFRIEKYGSHRGRTKRTAGVWRVDFD